MALQNGYRPINYENAIDGEQYIQASIEAVQYADVSKLEKIIFDGLIKNKKLQVK
ncbi:MAG: hypothetical protein Q9M36_08450 [Sulfurovum sp.]|nr:hypothetical protein [Sulfurovum sp.]